MADDGIATITATVLPDEIAKTISATVKLSHAKKLLLPKIQSKYFK